MAPQVTEPVRAYDDPRILTETTKSSKTGTCHPQVVETRRLNLSWLSWLH